MHYKRRRPKNRRAGCLLCKPHKRNGATLAKAGLGRTWLQEARARIDEREQRRED